MTLSEYLNRDGTSAAAFARELGVSHTTVLRWISGDMLPPLSRCAQIERATGGAVKAADFMPREVV